MLRPLLRTLRPRAAADAPPAPRWLVAAAYVFFPLISLAVAAAALRVSWDDVTRAPLLNYDDGDTLLILPMVKDAVERANHWRNDRLAAPGEFQTYDFPVVDHLHFACLWLVGQFTGSYVTAFNGYFLLAYPLTTLTTLWVFRRFGFSLAAAGAGGLLYAFLYYHASRSQAHYFLAAYWVVPLSLYLVLRVCKGDPPFFEPRGDRLGWAVWRRDSLAAVVIAALSALGGAYYGFFTGLFLGFAGVYGAVAARSWKPAAAAAVLAGVVTAAGVAAHAPAILYQMEHGRNPAPTKRLPVEAEYFGLKISPMLLPQYNHQSEAVGQYILKYHSIDRPLPSENLMAPLGVVGALGLIGVGVAFLLPIPRRWPYGPLGALVVFAILFATIGGLGSLFNYFVSPQVRAYSRMSVFVAFLALFASLWAVDRGLAGWPWVRAAVFAAVAAFGVWDQTPRPWFHPEIEEPRRQIAARFASDAEYFARVEAAVPGGMVLALPHLPYPESAPRHRLSSAYRFACGYLHTQTVRWSFGAMKERELDGWLAALAAEPIPVLVRRARESGFDAVCLDTFGYAEPDGQRMAAELTALCGPPVATQADGSRMLFDLRPRSAVTTRAAGD